MIISASYKTDIPTFYGEWFMNRLRAGYRKMINPYGGQIYRVDLSPEQIDGIVFWTKNIGPFIKYLPEIQQTNIPFIIQHTINGYPSQLESRVTNYERSIGYMQRLASEYGPERLVWRYDPIIFSSLTDYYWHLDNFSRLSAALKGTTDEVVISFAQLYVKTERNMEEAANQHGFSWDDHKSEDFVLEQGRKLATELAKITQSHGMHLKICSQKKFLIPDTVEEARCIDAERLERVSGTSIANKKKQQGNRKECGCFASKDIGEYDTCPHGCIYCYAVRNRDLALSRYQAHDPSSEFLFPPKNYRPEEQQTIQLATRQQDRQRKARKNAATSIKQENLSEPAATLWQQDSAPSNREE